MERQGLANELKTARDLVEEALRFRDRPLRLA
jgi:hypothetical protein